MPESEAPHLSVVIPAFNEELRITRSLRLIEDYLAAQEYSHEIIVVDDGSTDNTSEATSSSFPNVGLIRYEENHGKGYAVKQGMLAATGAYRLFYDADSSTPIEEIEKCWPKFDAGAQVVIGSRALPDSVIEVRQPWHRRAMGRMYNLLLRVLFLTNFPDTQCGFKVLTAESTDTVFSRQVMPGFGMDCEVLCIARIHGIPTSQVPVRWIDSPDTRVRAIGDSLNMFREVLIVRWNIFIGKYR